jgi:hypothetical protein
MKFNIILLFGASSAQQTVVFRATGVPQGINPKPGSCTPLFGNRIIGAQTGYSVALKFYNDYECKGSLVAYSNGKFHRKLGYYGEIHSVKVVSNAQFRSEDSIFSYYAERSFATWITYNLQLAILFYLIRYVYPLIMGQR